MNTSRQSEAPPVFAPWPFFDDEQIAAVAQVLRSGKTNYWNGNQCREFERAFSDYVGVEFGISLANGTVALELGLRALQLGPGDEVVVPARSYIATASAVCATGATPVFADIDPDTETISADTIAAALSSATRAIVVVHLYGCPCAMGPIMDLAGAHRLALVEDCAQAHGAAINNKRVGSYGDVAAFSFCQDKIISTAGEGGMLLCRDEAVYQRAWSYKDHGKAASVRDQPRDANFRYVHNGPGTNWRMTEIQAAVGRIQLRRLDSWLCERRRNADTLIQLLQSQAVLAAPEYPHEVDHARYRLLLQLSDDSLNRGWTQQKILTRLAQAGVPAGAGVCPELYREQALAPYAPDMVLKSAAKPPNSIVLPVHPGLSLAQLSWIAGRISELGPDLD